MTKIYIIIARNNQPEVPDDDALLYASTKKEAAIAEFNITNPDLDYRQITLHEMEEGQFPVLNKILRIKMLELKEVNNDE